MLTQRLLCRGTRVYYSSSSALILAVLLNCHPSPSLLFLPLPLVLSGLTTPVMASSSSDVVVLAVGIILAAVYLFRDQLFAASKPKTVPTSSSKANAGGGNPRDFIAKMKEGVSV